jgi:hypothetical protein
MLTCGSRDGETMPSNNSSGSMKKLRPLEIITGRTIASRSNQMVAQAILEPVHQSHQDGGNFSDLRIMLSLPIIEERSLKFLEELTMRTKIS